MAIPPTATLILDQEHGPALEDGADGIKGVRHFRVDTHDEGEALAAAGLPVKNDPWSPSLPELVCRRRATEYIGGTNDAISGIGGWTRVRIDYEELTSTVAPLAGRGVQYTLLTTRVSGVTVMRDINPAGSNRAIENGKGTQREIGGTVATVVTFPSVEIASPQILAMVELQARQGVNADTILLPRILGTGLRLSLGPRQARYHDFEVGVEAGYLKLTHVLLLSEDAASWYWWSVGVEGEALARQESRIYEEASFAGLW